MFLSVGRQRDPIGLPLGLADYAVLWLLLAAVTGNLGGPSRRQGQQEQAESHHGPTPLAGVGRDAVSDDGLSHGHAGWSLTVSAWLAVRFEPRNLIGSAGRNDWDETADPIGCIGRGNRQTLPKRLVLASTQNGDRHLAAARFQDDSRTPARSQSPFETMPLFCGGDGRHGLDTSSPLGRTCPIGPHA